MVKIIIWQLVIPHLAICDTGVVRAWIIKFWYFYYLTQVRPIFSNGEEGTFSKAIAFFPRKPTGIKMHKTWWLGLSNYLKNTKQTSTFGLHSKRLSLLCLIISSTHTGKGFSWESIYMHAWLALVTIIVTIILYTYTVNCLFLNLLW
jgi:hypothetical protein